MGYKFFDRRFLVMPDDKDIIGKKVFYQDHLDMLICDVESGDISRTGTLDAIIANCSFPFYTDSSRWGLCYYDTNYEAKVAYSQGKKIQVRLPNTDEWLDTKEPAWAEASEYRVKPDEPASDGEGMKEVALNIWNERDMSVVVTALSKSYSVRTVQNTAYTDRPQPFTIIVEVPDDDVREVKA